MIINNKRLLSLAKEKYKDVDSMSKKEALSNARYIKLWNMIKNTYFIKIIPFTNITIGRIRIVLYRFLGLIKKQASADITQFQGIKKISNVQAELLNNQLKKIKGINNHRRKISEIYNTKLKEEFRYQSNNKALLRYPVLISNKEEIKGRLLKEEIIVGNWYRTPVYPLDNKLKDVGYVKGSCPVAEECGENILNLPTNIKVTKDNAVKIVKIINTFAKPANI
jgi:dTDP-4-amino-4,6-dideoxygalactose transaminase